MKYRGLRLAVIVVVLGMSLFSVPTVSANTDSTWRLGDSIIPEVCTKSDSSVQGECGVTEIIQTLIHIAQWILAVIGAVSLGYFVYGGFTLLTAAGNTSRVDHGRKVLVGTVVGLIIVLASFSIVQWIGTLVGGGAAPPAFDKFLDTTTSSSSDNSCVRAEDGERCRNLGWNTYACVSGRCSEATLCNYWAQKTNSYGIGSGHVCRPQADCVSGTEVSGLCPGATAAEGICCIPQ